MKPVLDVPTPIAIAHRGSRTLWPENTIFAFQQAVDLGYTWIETDLHVTADGVLVCLHDDTLDRTTDATGFVWDRTMTDLAAVDAGARLTSSGERPFAGRGIGVPSFEETVTTFPEARFVVDLKQDGLAVPLVRLIDRLELWDRLVVGSFSDRRLLEFRLESGHRVATSTGPRETLRAWSGAWVGRAPELADAVQVPISFRGLRVITRRTVAGFRAAGYHVHVWTVDDTRTMERLLDIGVHGIITDRPDLLRDVLIRRRAWHP